MSQLNIHVTPNFEKALIKFMKLRHIQTKYEAIRVAINEGIQHAAAERQPVDFSSWLEMGLQVPVNKKAKFSSDDDLWR